jgi:hypothetical protein
MLICFKERVMGTLSGVWDRLKPLLEGAMKSTPQAGSKVDQKKAAAAIQQFISQFGGVMTQMATIYQKKKEVDASFKEASEKGLKLLDPLLKQLDAAHKDGFNPNNSAHQNIDDRISEMMDRLKELKQYGSQTQWD